MPKSKRNAKTRLKNSYKVYSKPEAVVNARLDKKLDEHLKATYVDAYGSFGFDMDGCGVAFVGCVRREVPILSLEQWLWMFLCLSENNDVLDQHLKECVYYTSEGLGLDTDFVMAKSDFDALTVLNLNAIWFIGRKFCLDRDFNVSYLRKVIGDLMNRAPEFVFKEDFKRLQIV